MYDKQAGKGLTQPADRSVVSTGYRGNHVPPVAQYA